MSLHAVIAAAPRGALGHCCAMSCRYMAERSSANRLGLNWRAQRGSLDAPSLYAAPYSRFERSGLYGCERQVRTCPRHDKARSFRTGRTGIMLAETPYHFLLNLQVSWCMAAPAQRMAASSACTSISRRSWTLLRNVLSLHGRAKLGLVVNGRSGPALDMQKPDPFGPGAPESC